MHTKCHQVAPSVAKCRQVSPGVTNLGGVQGTPARQGGATRVSCCEHDTLSAPPLARRGALNTPRLVTLGDTWRHLATLGDTWCTPSVTKCRQVSQGVAKCTPRLTRCRPWGHHVGVQGPPGAPAGGGKLYWLPANRVFRPQPARRGCLEPPK